MAGKQKGSFKECIYRLQQEILSQNLETKNERERERERVREREREREGEREKIFHPLVALELFLPSAIK